MKRFQRSRGAKGSGTGIMGILIHVTDYPWFWDLGFGGLID